MQSNTMHYLKMSLPNLARETIEWLENHQEWIIDNDIRYGLIGLSIKTGNFDLIDRYFNFGWFSDNGFKLKQPRFFDVALSENPNIEMLRKLMEIGSKLMENPISQIITFWSYYLKKAARKGNLDTFKFILEMIGLEKNWILHSEMLYPLIDSNRPIVEEVLLGDYFDKSKFHLVYDGQLENGFHNDLQLLENFHLNRYGQDIIKFTKKSIFNAVDKGYFDIVKFLYFNRTEGFDDSAIHIAAFNGRLDIVKFLYNHKSNPNNNIKETPLENLLYFSRCRLRYNNLDVLQFIMENIAESDLVKISRYYMEYNQYDQDMYQLQNVDQPPSRHYLMKYHNQCLPDPQFESLFEQKNYQILKFILANYQHDFDSYFIQELFYPDKPEFRNWDLIKFLYKCIPVPERFPFTKKTLTNDGDNENSVPEGLDLVILSCSNRNLEIFKYIVYHPSFKDVRVSNVGFMIACQANNIQLLDYLYNNERFRHSIETDIQKQLTNRETGQLFNNMHYLRKMLPNLARETIEWLENHQEWIIDNDIRYGLIGLSIKTGNFDLIDRYLKFGWFSPPNAFPIEHRTFIEAGLWDNPTNIPMLEKLLEIDREIMTLLENSGLDYLVIAARNGNLDTFKFVLENLCPKMENLKLIKPKVYAFVNSIRPIVEEVLLGNHFDKRDFHLIDDSRLSDGFHNDLQLLENFHLNRYGQDIIKFSKKSIFNAVDKGYFDIVKFLLLNRTEGFDDSAIHLAALKKRLDIVKFLHEHKLNQNQKTLSDHLNYVSLYTRVYENLDVVQYFYENIEENKPFLRITGNEFSKVSLNEKKMRLETLGSLFVKPDNAFKYIIDDLPFFEYLLSKGYYELSSPIL
eukprot:gene3914-4887_t